MSLQQSSVPDHVKEALADFPNFSDDVEWLHKVSSKPDPDTDGDILQVLLTMIENVLSMGSPMLGTQEGHRIAGCLNEVRSSYPQHRESLLDTLDNHGLISRGGPIFVVAETKPVPATRSLVEAMRKGRRALGNAKRSVEDAAQQNQTAIDAAVRGIENKSKESTDAINGSVQQVEERS